MKTNKEQSKLERAIELVKMLPGFELQKMMDVGEWRFAYYDIEDWPDKQLYVSGMTERFHTKKKQSHVEEVILTSLIADLERHLGIKKIVKPRAQLTYVKSEDSSKNLGYLINKINELTEHVIMLENKSKLDEVGGGDE